MLIKVKNGVLLMKVKELLLTFLMPYDLHLRLP
jgi:hypothetical protein